MIVARVTQAIVTFAGPLGALLAIGLLGASTVLSGSFGAGAVTVAAILAFGLAAGLLLSDYPLATFSMALLLYCAPFGLWPEAISGLMSNVSLSLLALALAAWLVDVATTNRRIYVNATFVLLLLFLLWGIYSLAWAGDLVAGRRKLVAYTIGISLFFLAEQHIRSRRELRIFNANLSISAWALLAAGAVSALFFFDGHDRLQVASTNPNELAMLLLVALPGLFWRATYADGRSRAIAYGLCALYVAGTIVIVGLSGSRGGAISIVATMCVFMVLGPTRKAGLIGACILIVVLATMPFVLDGILSRLNEDYGGRTGGRDVLWQAGLQLFGDNITTGVGIGNGPYELHNYISALTSDYNKRGDLPSHNPLIEVGIDTGFIGLGLYLAACATAIGRFLGSWRYWRIRDRGMDLYCSFVCAALVGFTLSWIKSGGVDNHPNLMCFLMLLSTAGLGRNSHASSDRSQGYRSPGACNASGIAGGEQVSRTEPAESGKQRATGAEPK
jgi:putative inorganic carbon (HCO3(-)) transporter